MSDIVKQFDNMVGHIVSINDDRDIVPLLLGLKDMWPQLRTEIERLEAALWQAREDLAHLVQQIDAALKSAERSET